MDLPRSCRKDGWTTARQLAFLDALARTRSVTAAARSAGMSRESAYRLRGRDSAGAFAAAWDRVLAAPRPRRPRARATARPGSRNDLRFGSGWLAQELLFSAELSPKVTK